MSKKIRFIQTTKSKNSSNTKCNTWHIRQDNEKDGLQKIKIKVRQLLIALYEVDVALNIFETEGIHATENI